MRANEALFRPEDASGSPFARAAADERGLAPEEVVPFVNAWIGRVRERTEGSGCSGPVLRDLLDGLRSFGFLPSAIRSMARRFPNLLCCGWVRAHGTEDTPGLLLLLQGYGFTREQLLRMCFRLPALLSYSWARTHGTEQDPGILLRLERYGFSRGQVISMCARFPALLSYAWARTHGTKDVPGILLRLEEYGFTRDQLITICQRCPTIPGYSWKRTHSVLLRMEAAGFDLAHIISLCVQCPILLRCRWERTAVQLRLAQELALPLTPQLFLFAPGKTRWRWHHLTGTRGLSERRSRAALFLSREDFLRRFGGDYGAGMPDVRSRP